jgi:hypothetical protein
MQKECKIRKDLELIKFFEFSMIRSESAVPDSSKIRRYFGIGCSGSASGSAMIVLISEGYKISTLFANQTKGPAGRKDDALQPATIRVIFDAAKRATGIEKSFCKLRSLSQIRDVKFGPTEEKYMFINNTAEKEETLIGFVYEIEEKGWVKGLAISTGDEEYVVEANEWIEKLGKEIENDVRVTGLVSRDSNGKNRILVTGYEVLHDENDYRGNYNLGGEE